MHGITSLPVVIQVLKIVSEVNTVLFQESMNLRAGVMPKQLPQLRHGELVFAISFESNSFQGGAFQAMPGTG
jgi:hypothetical protein